MNILFVVFLAVTPGPQTDMPQSEPRKPRFTVGKKTTYVNGPRDKQGFIDYATALNKRLRGAITAEQNANVLLWKAFGPHPEGANMPREFFTWMGVPAPPKKGDYFIDLSRFVKGHVKSKDGDLYQKLQKNLDLASARPWTAKRFPHLAKWIKANEKPLKLVAAAAQRRHYYNPLVPAKGGRLIGALLPGAQKTRQFAQILTARAMLRLGEGQEGKAWEDLLTMHRLGRLVGRGGTLIELLVGYAIDMIAHEADIVYVSRAKLNSKQIQSRLHDLQSLPPFSTVADRLDLFERFVFLDIVMGLNRNGLQDLERLSGGAAPKPNPKLKALDGKVDWDPALRAANDWYDRMAAILRGKNRALREKQIIKLGDELRGLKKSAARDVAPLFRADTNPKMRGRIIGEVLVALLVPAFHKVQHAADRVEQMESNRHVAFALEAYKRLTGRYPDTLDTLAPKFLAIIPNDLFSGNDLIYRPKQDGYLLYSVGVNGKDEGGRYYDDDPRGDDPRVHMPLKKR